MILPPAPSSGLEDQARLIVAQRSLITGVFLLVPIAHLVGLVRQPSGPHEPVLALSPWIWMAALVLGVVALVVGSVSLSALKLSAPFGLFLLFAGLSVLWTDDAHEGLDMWGRLLTPYVVYLAAFHSARDELLIRRVRTMSAAWIGMIGASFLVVWWLRLIPTYELSRLMGVSALSLAPLMVFATFGMRSFQRTLLVGSVAVGIAMAADARMVLLVLAVLLIAAPALNVDFPRRVLVGAVAAGALVALVFLPSLGGRWFLFNSGDSVGTVLTWSESILGKRAEVWSLLLGECSDQWLVGKGVGSSNVIGREFHPAFTQPHNEYVRAFCDTGVVGATLLWVFPMMVGARALRLSAVSRLSHPEAVAALQTLVALVLLGITDFPLAATVQFMAPVAVAFAWSDRIFEESVRRFPRSG